LWAEQVLAGLLGVNPLLDKEALAVLELGKKRFLAHG
jgi:hypothetical protein